MASSVISNQLTYNTDIVLKQRRKKKKTQRRFRDQLTQNVNNNKTLLIPPPWKSKLREEAYRSKLLQAVRQVRFGSGSGSLPVRGRAVREAADRALAMAVKGRSRWSRAILRNLPATGSSRLRKRRAGVVLRLKRKELPAVQRKGGILGRLVPGCRRQPLAVVLEEATDYIAALEMQVKAMAALAELFTGGG